MKKNMTEILKKAKKKKIFQNNEFQKILKKILLADENLTLDWDDGAGEEWARFYNQTDGKVCMINAKIGIAFIRISYEFNNINNVIDMLEVVFTDDYGSDDWFIDLADLKESIPELYWHTSEEAVNPNGFSLDDFYFATV